MSLAIQSIHAQEILDSRGTPTIRVTVETEEAKASFDVPSGASTGIYEAHELRDEEERFGGKGVKKAVQGINTEIEKALKGITITDQKKIDEILIELDGTENKKRLGGNALIGVSIACAKAAARSQGNEVYEYLRMLADIKPSRAFPLLYMNIINGGKHTSDDGHLAFQEYHVVPMVEGIEEALAIGVAVQKEVSRLFKEELHLESIVGLGDEGGFALDVASVETPLRLLNNALANLGIQGQCKLAMDVAASSFYKEGVYELEGKKLSAEELGEVYKKMTEDYPILSIEDPYFEEHFDAFADMKKKHENLIVVGDDLTVTNPKRLEKALAKESINGIIIKPNQIGTLSETLSAMKIARENNVECIVSHRSGETNDDFIADLAYAFGAFGIKGGAPQRGERIAKYNRLLTIEQNTQ